MKTDKWLANIAAAAAKAGITFVPEVVHSTGEAEVLASRQGDAVIFYFQNPDAFAKVECVFCRNSFLVNRRFVNCCSEVCRTAHYEERYGIKWDSSLPAAKRWASLGGEPLCIPPEALARLIHLAELQNVSLVALD